MIRMTNGQRTKIALALDEIKLVAHELEQAGVVREDDECPLGCLIVACSQLTDALNK